MHTQGQNSQNKSRLIESINPNQEKIEGKMKKNEPQKSKEEDDDYRELEQHVNWKKESKKNQTMEAFEEDYQCVGGFGIWNLKNALEN